MSDNKINGQLDFRNITNSQLGSGNIAKAEFSEIQSAKKVFSTTPILKDSYTHIIQEVDSNNRVTSVEYYQALGPAIEKITCVADVAGSLAGTYFAIYESISKKSHGYYFVVSGSGTAPGLFDTETAITINTNDTAVVVAYAAISKIRLDSNITVVNSRFTQDNFTISYNQFGDNTSFNLGNSGFSLESIQEGSSKLVGQIELSYDVNGNIVYNGNTLKGMTYNQYSAIFESGTHLLSASGDVITHTDKEGKTSLDVNVSNLKKTSYGDLKVESQTTITSANAVYDFIPSNFRTFLNGTGTASTEDGMFITTSGTALGNYGVIRSFRSLNYKTGQGASIKFSGIFETPQSLTESGMGGFNIGDELSFGYNGLVFGIWHRYNGFAEVQELEITGAAGGSEDATLTLNDVVYTIPLTSGTVQKNAYEIATYLNANATELEAEQIDDIVRIDYLSDGNKTGTFSFSSSTATATITERTQGVTKTSDHTPLDDFNGTVFDGFDPSKGNNYQINYQNGFGDIRFYIEDKLTGDYDLAHTLQWINNETQPNMTNPSLRVGCYTTSIGATTPVTVKMAYITAFVDGKLNKIRNPRAFSNTKNIGTTDTNILTIKNSRTYNARANQVEIEPVFLTLANDGSKTAVFEIRANAIVSGTTNFQEAGSDVVSQYDITGGTVSGGGRLLGSFVVAKGQSLAVSLSDLKIRVPPSLRLTVYGKMTSGSSADLTASLTWYEDI